MSNGNVLVTGSSGHLGLALMLSLQSFGYNPVGMDIIPAERTAYVGCISDKKFVSSVFSSVSSGIQHVLHVATLHKPHVDSHSKADFIKTNILGTLVLLEEASQRAVRSFIFISTTSAFGRALSPKPGMPAAWIDETVASIPKNIYGVTKVAAEDLCHLVHQQTKMPTLVLRTSRFFPEEDDDDERRNSLDDENLKALELCYRRVDIADVVSACVCAMQKAPEIAWSKYIISAPTPFAHDATTLRLLDGDVAEALLRSTGGYRDVFERKKWNVLTRIDRVYDSTRAVEELGWEPQYTFNTMLARVQAGQEWRSEMSFSVGKRGYHDVSTGVYTNK